MEYQSMPITLKKCTINKKDPRFDVYIVTKETKLEPSTIVKVEYKKLIREAEVPRTKVLFVNEADEIYEVCTFEAPVTPPLDQCTLLFPIPLANAVKVDDPGGGCSVTSIFSLAKDFDLIKFGTDYYSLTISRVERARNMRRKVKRVHRMDILDFSSQAQVNEMLGDVGVPYFWASFDQFFSHKPVETAMALLEMADVDEILPHLESLRGVVDRGTKRMRLIS